MSDQLQRLRKWASHGSMRQFYTELDARLADEGYELELTGDTLTVYRVRREGGFLGIGQRQVRESVMQIICQPEGVEISEQHADPEFIDMLATRLQAH